MSHISHIAPYQLHEWAYIRNVDPTDRKVEKNPTEYKISVAQGHGSENDKKCSCCCTCEKPNKDNNHKEENEKNEQQINDEAKQREGAGYVIQNSSMEQDSPKESPMEEQENSTNSDNEDWISSVKPVKINQEEINKLLAENSSVSSERKRKTQNKKKYNYKNFFCLINSFVLVL